MAVGEDELIAAAKGRSVADAGQDTRRQIQDLRVIAGRQRKLNKWREYSPPRRAWTFPSGLSPLVLKNGHLRLLRSKLKRLIQDTRLGYVDRHRGGLNGLETGSRNRNFIGTRRQQSKSVGAARARSLGAC